MELCRLFGKLLPGKKYSGVKPMAKILLVEDELDLARLIQNWLNKEQHIVEAVHDGEIALRCLQVSDYDLIIMDVMIPGLNGLEVSKKFREDNGTTPIMILTAGSTLDEKEKGFLAGADDYLTKPFHLKELVFRAHALMKRGSVATPHQLYIRNDILIDTNKNQVLKDGEKVNLLPKEYRLLEFLARNPNRVFSAEELIEKVWESDTCVHKSTVRGHVNRIRNKLDDLDPAKPSVITTVYGVGYKLSKKERSTNSVSRSRNSANFTRHCTS